MNETSRSTNMQRRRLLRNLAAASAIGLGGCAVAPRLAPNDRARFLAPLLARTDRVFDTTVCLRPFRAAGPRLDTERIGDTRVVHNYGHGGSGWSLSWGSSSIAVGHALSWSPERIAVVGCGVMGMTSALLAQAAGKPVTIYAKEMIQESSSARASGSFTPDSRLALADAVSEEFPVLWEKMVRTSLKTFRGHLGLAGQPVRWIDRYIVSDTQAPVARPSTEGALKFASFGDRYRDLYARTETLRPADTPFRAESIRRRSVLMFNISSYSQMLMSQFRLGGGQVVLHEFQDPAELTRLPEKVVINCTGYGARALWRDETLVPVRGQLAYLIPQPEFDYALAFREVNVVPRSDGIVVQTVAGGDMRGYNDASEVPDRQEVDIAIRTLAELYSKFRR